MGKSLTRVGQREAIGDTLRNFSTSLSANVGHFIQPISEDRAEMTWEDDFARFGRTTLLLAHARSAFHCSGLSTPMAMNRPSPSQANTPLGHARSESRPRRFVDRPFTV